MLTKAEAKDPGLAMEGGSALPQMGPEGGPLLLLQAGGRQRRPNRMLEKGQWTGVVPIALLGPMIWPWALPGCLGPGLRAEEEQETYVQGCVLLKQKLNF